MFESRQIGRDTIKEIAPNLIVRCEGLYFREAVGFPDIIYLTFEISKGVAMALLTAWLYDKLKGRVEKLRIEGIDVQIDEGEIKRILINKIEKSED